MNTLFELASYLQNNDDYVLVGHERPDHDSLGSMLGLYFGLRRLGKKMQAGQRRSSLGQFKLARP